MGEITIAQILGELASYLITGGIIFYIVYRLVIRKRKHNKKGIKK